MKLDSKVNISSKDTLTPNCVCTSCVGGCTAGCTGCTASCHFTCYGTCLQGCTFGNNIPIE